MRTGLCTALAAIGLALVLGGCPVNAGDRDGQGAGHLFGGGPSIPVTVTITDIYITDGTPIEVRLNGEWETRQTNLEIRRGSLVITWNAVPAMQDHTIDIRLNADPWVRWIMTEPQRFQLGENIVPWDQFQPF